MTFWEDLHVFPNYCFIAPNGRIEEFHYTRDLLNRIDINNQYILIVDTNYIPTLNFPYDFLEKYKAYADSKNLIFKILLLNLGEGICYEDFKSEITQIKIKYNINYENIITFSLALPNKKYPIKHAITYRATCREDILPCSKYEIIPTHHFVSLSRIPRKHRVLANVEILKRQLNQYGHMSICSSALSNKNGRIQQFINLIPEEFINKFPTYLDGSMEQGSKLDWFYTIDERITHAFAHVVMETSYEYTDPWGTHVPMISEKSMKPLAWGQIPIFICYHNQLKYLRNLGFDIFDDVIDHSYDDEPDPDKRIVLAVDQLERLCKSKTVAELQQFKVQNLDRFAENRQKVLSFFQNEKWQHSFPNLKNSLI